MQFLPVTYILPKNVFPGKKEGQSVEQWFLPDCH